MAGAHIRADDWGYQYPGRSTPALAHVTLEIEPGALVVLLGATGSGKSTFMSALADVLPAAGARGRLTVDGGDRAAAGRVGLVQQHPESNIIMERVGDDVAFPMEGRAIPRQEIWPRVGEALAAVGLRIDPGAPTARLSGGQQQLLALASASADDPRLLLLDEPTANLDPAAAAEVVAAVLDERHRTGCTVVVVEHRVEPWLARADLVLVADDGTVRPVPREGLARFLTGRPDLRRRLWLDHADLVTHPPARPAGRVLLEATGLVVADRLRALDLEVRACEVVALTGPPGSGKSTLLACVAGLMAPTGGSVSVETSTGTARDPWRWPSGRIAETFGVVFQDPEQQFLTASVRDELVHTMAVAGLEPGRVERRADTMLARLGLDHLAGVDPFTLSGGEQRRLSVGTALVRAPGILVLDEPTFGQDRTTWAQVVDIVAAHRDAGGAVLLATHDPHLVTALSARRVALSPVPRGAQPERPAAGLRRLDPLALVGGAGLLSVAALASASVALNLALAAAAIVVALVGGLGRRRMALLAVPALVAAASVALSNALLGSSGISSWAAWQSAALPASRILAVALPGLVAAIAVDPTALADSLVVRARVPARAAYAVLAGLRLLPLLADEWDTLERASRARGLRGSGVGGRLRHVASMTFRLLVAALRRAGRLAVSLDVRGLRAEGPRTVARPVRWRGPDTLALVVGLLALALGLATRA